MADTVASWVLIVGGIVAILTAIVTAVYAMVRPIASKWIVDEVRTQLDRSMGPVQLELKTMNGELGRIRDIEVKLENGLLARTRRLEEKVDRLIESLASS